MKRLTLPGGGPEHPTVRQMHIGALTNFGAERADLGADLLKDAQAAETEQQYVLEATSDEGHQEMLALYVQAKHDQVGHIEDRLENLIDRQQARLQQTQAVTPGRLSLPGPKREWDSRQAMEQARLQTLHARLEVVREIKEGMGLHSPRLEELASKKMRAENPELPADWDAMREAGRRHDLLMRKESRAPERASRARTLTLSAKST